jgi:N-methylhydantoinase A
MQEGFDALTQQAEAWFVHETIAPADRRTTRTVDMRYAGQNYELPIALPDGAINEATLAALAQGFAAEHQRAYGFTAEGDPVQLVTFRMEATGIVPKARFAAQADAGPDASGAIIGERAVWLPEAGGFVTCPIYDRDGLRAGNRISGPAIVEQMDATTVILPGMQARIEPGLNLILETA